MGNIFLKVKLFLTLGEIHRGKELTEPPAEEQERKSLLDEGHELDRKKHAEKAGRQKLPPETVKRIEKGG